MRVVVLISGRGSNLRAIIDATHAGNLPIELRAVISNEPDAPGLRYAQAAHIPTHVVCHHDFTSRDAFDKALMQRIDSCEPQLVVLAGFLRILGKDFIGHYAGCLINIHPSLLPDFPGLNTHARALESGVAWHGATVHFVTNEVDTGPIIAQTRIKVLPNDTRESLATRVLEGEHRIFPLAIRWFAENRLSLDGRRVLLDGKVRPEQGLNGNDSDNRS